jgi:hypothetical protein
VGHGAPVQKFVVPVAESAAGAAEKFVAVDPVVEALVVLFGEGGVAEVEHGDVAERVTQRGGQVDRSIECGHRGG